MRFLLHALVQSFFTAALEAHKWVVPGRASDNDFAPAFVIALGVCVAVVALPVLIILLVVILLAFKMERESTPR